MSGHSKWSTIKRKKGALDAKRGNIFTKLIYERTIAGRIGGGDIDGNPRLRTAVQAAKSANMPQDNITRAIAKGTGDLDGITYEELSYEGYGPGGVAILINVLTDNKNRTGSEIRHLLTKGSGNMAEPNAVAWNFEKKGLILIPKNDEDEDRLMEIVLESEADDMQVTDDFYEIHTTPDKFEFILNEIKQNKFVPESAEVSMIPKTTIKLEGKEAEQMLRLLESIEDNDDVQNVYANFDISDEEMEKVTL